MPFSVTRSIFVVLFIFSAFFFGINSATSQKNTLGLKIDTLKAFYTSGQAPQKVIGTIELSLTLPPKQTATLFMKTNPQGSYTSFNNYGNNTAVNNQNLKVSIPNLFVRDDIYCFKLEAKDAPGSLSTSKELCSVPFYKVPKNNADDKVVLEIKSFQPADPGQGFSAIITSNCLDPSACTADIDRNTLGHNSIFPYTVEKVLEAKVRCGEEKIFQITLNIEGMISISDTIHNFGITKNIPGNILDKWLYATVDKDKVNLKWRNDIIVNPENYALAKKFVVSRKDENRGIFNALATTDTQFIHPTGNKFEWQFTDPTSSPETKKHDYQLKYQDFCGNESFATNVSPIFLSQNSSFELIWSNENDSKVTGYELMFYDKKEGNPRNIKPLSLTENKFLSDETAIFFRIRGKQKDGDGSYIYSNFLENSAEIIVNNPTIITPDGQGPPESETFKVYCSAYNSFSIVIYDRNGQKMYESTSYEAHKREGWNGKLPFSDIDAPEGIYIFQVDVENKVFKKLSKKGSFLLVRK
jgi:CHU_C Type IX secretion signal domain